MEKVRIGLIGVGWIGSHHGQNVLKNAHAELVALANPACDWGKVEQFKAGQGISPRCYTDYQELLAQDDIDAVIIASPNGAHAEQAIAAAQAGKHIYLEKPMAITLEDCKRVRDAVKPAGVKFLIGYHRRFTPLYQHARKLIQDGYFGNPFFVESNYLHHIPGDLAIWEWAGKADIGGSLFHAGSGHNVDLIRFFGGDIAEVSCFKDIYLPRKQQVETEDTAVAIFRFKNGMLGKVMLCVGPVLPFTFSFALYGTQGTMLDNRLWLDSAPDYYEIGHEKDYIKLPESWLPDNVQGGIGEAWNKCLDHFIDAIVHDQPTINDVDSAYATSEACFAAMIAASEKRVVALPL